MILKTLFSFFSCLTGWSLWFSQRGRLGWCPVSAGTFAVAVEAELRVGLEVWCWGWKVARSGGGADHVPLHTQRLQSRGHGEEVVVDREGKADFFERGRWRLINVCRKAEGEWGHPRWLQSRGTWTPGRQWDEEELGGNMSSSEERSMSHWWWMCLTLFVSVQLWRGKKIKGSF